jgi:nitroreductase
VSADGRHHRHRDVAGAVSDGIPSNELVPTLLQSWNVIAPPAERPLSALDAIFVRRSIRAYTAQQPDQATIRALLDAAVQAPTAMQDEPWAFAVVQDKTALRRYSDRAKAGWMGTGDQYRSLHHGVPNAAEHVFAMQMADPDFNLFYDAGTLIAVCARHAPFVTADCWMAAENLMLAACALGLGSCCIGSAIPLLNSDDIKTELGVPWHYEVVVPIVVGVPASAPPRAIRKEPRILSWR